MRDAILLACLRAVVILVPSYTAAWLSGEMVWTIPTLAAAASLAAAIRPMNDSVRRVDDDGGDGDGDGDTEDDVGADADPDGGDS